MTKERLQHIFQNPYSARDWQEVLIEIFGITKRYRTPQSLESSTNEKVEGYELGRIRTKDGYEIGVFEFEIKTGDTIEMSRVGLRGLVSSYVNYNVDAALVVYHSTTQWRLSFISNLKGESTTPKRFTYVFGDPKQLYRTPIDRFVELEEKGILFSTIYEAFSVEKLNDDFFKAYKGLYSVFCNKLPDGKASRDFVKRMMGRLVFLHFVQKKGWLGNDQHYLQNLLKNSKENYYDTFLTDVLHVLFFDTLNEKRKGDKVNPILGENITIPYLNGGLFEADEADRQGINFPFEYFEWLLNFFSLFNFTIDENDPSDAEVGIDPEMLGHIFENLLEDNKDKGAFYTPKEIVRYMCQESLLQFLGKNDELKFKTFTDIFCIEDKITATKVNNLLTSVKICDPAIGSGAFPMGILTEIFNARKALHPVINSDPFIASEVKKEIIQNNIYGVDIEQGAVDIARLRFWLSLVVDEKEPQPLPNLDYKIMQGNSLLESFEGIDLSNFSERSTELNLFGTDETKDEIKKLINDYFAVTDHTVKHRLRTEIDEKVHEHIKRSCGHNPTIVTKVDEIEPTKRPFFLWHVYFNDVFEKGGFDIIIGNPPYGATLTPEEKSVLRKLYTTAQTNKNEKGSLDTYTMFIEKGYKLLQTKGNLAYIVPISVTSSDSVVALHNLLEQNCDTIKISSYAVRPKPVFDHAVVNTSILFFHKTLTPCTKILMTKMHRRSKTFSLKQLIDELSYINIKGYKLKGRYPKINYEIEQSILSKIFDCQTSIGDLIENGGSPIYYRTTGGRYFKVITNYSTGSTKEKPIFFNPQISNIIGAILSSNLFFWYYQIFSNNLDLKNYELASFKIPIEKVDQDIKGKIEKIYAEYLIDIETNSNVRQTSKYANIEVFKEYKIGKSKGYIDQIDDIISSLYNFSAEELSFIKNYEIEYRLSDNDTPRL